MTLRRRVFVAHAEADSELVNALAELLRRRIALKDEEVFISSEGSIRAGEQFPAAIRNGLREVDVVIALLTPNSRWRPWLHFEAGGAFFSDRELFVVSALGITPSSLPSNLNVYSLTRLGTTDGVDRLCTALTTALRLRRKPTKGSNRATRNLVRAAAGGAPGWDRVQPAFIAEQTKGSPFELPHVLKVARELVFLAGQNLYSLTKGPAATELKAAVFEFLRRDDTRLQILLQDPDFHAGVQAFTALMADFEDDLRDSVAGFKRWLKEAQREGINKTSDRRLDIRLAKLVPVSFMMLDPETPRVSFLCTPVLHRGATSPVRPAVCFSGAGPISEYYWHLWSFAFCEARRLRPD